MTVGWDSDLLQELHVPCTMLNPGWVDDEYGGQKSGWFEGMKFEAILNVNNSIQSKVAGAELSTNFYGVKTHRDVVLEYHNVFRCDTDGKIYRVTDPDANKTPPSSDIDMRQVTAEEWKLPVNG